MIHSTEKSLTKQIDGIRNPKPPLGTRLPQRKAQSLSDMAKKKGGNLY